LSGQQEPERIGATLNTIKEPTSGCKLNNLLKYHSFLSKARQVADSVGLKLIEDELKRVKGKYLYFESSSVNTEGV
jgi:hypothetical protein